ncbi:MAG: transglycosylase domain-containing protein [Bacteriovoracaceae bacterium]|nr:transglycosylase domain-containing protein [Bacteriovoracaceae bacterium]
MDENSQKLEETKTPKSLKKKLLIFSFVFNFFIVIALIYFYGVFPRQEIQDLEKGHILVTVGADQSAEYQFVSNKPKSWVTLKDMNYTAAHAIVVSEDWAFYNHSGYDLGQIKEAAEEAIEGERTRGASTISQQVVKNIYLTSEKSLTRKLKELFYSTYMERNVSKEKILETYLNIAEFGPGIYGIKAASQYYFKKRPKDLSPREGAFLAMLLPSPKRYGESFREKKMTDFASKTVDSILKKMVRAKYLKPEQLEKVKEQSFSWEEEVTNTGLKANDAQVETSIENPKKNLRKTRVVKRKRKHDLTGKSLDQGHTISDQLKLEENPEFDEDALVEDVSGAEAEFNVQ